MEHVTLHTCTEDGSEFVKADCVLHEPTYVTMQCQNATCNTWNMN